MYLSRIFATVQQEKIENRALEKYRALKKFTLKCLGQFDYID